MPTILTAVHEPHEQNSSLDAPEEQLGHIPPDPSSTAGAEPGVRDQEESKDQGKAVQQPLEVLAESASEGDRVGEGAYGGVPSGECWYPR